METGRTSPQPAEVLAITADSAMARQVLSVAATVGIDVEVVTELEAVRSRWRTAPIVLVGTDQAATVAGLHLPRRSAFYVLGWVGDAHQCHTWSVRLGAVVLTLPGGGLADVMAQLIAGPTTVNASVCVVGGSGGVGASTLATGLAVTSTRAGSAALLVDADPLGGGIDLLLGAEHLDGWRWSRLAAARGYLGDLGGQLPSVDGVDLLAMDRTPTGALPLQPEQAAAVADWAVRRYRLTVWDLPRTLGPAINEALRRAEETLLLVQADVRGVAAASAVAVRLQRHCGALGLVVRARRSRGLDATTVADALGLPLRATVEDEPALAGGAERGDPPGRSSRSSLSRVCRTLLAHAEDGRQAA